MTTLQYVMTGIGALALLAGLLLLVTRIRTLVSGCRTDAVVVDEKIEISRSKSGKEIRLSRPVFEFTHEGKTYRCQSSLAAQDSPKRGSRMPVRYLPSDPASTAERDAFLPFWGFPLVSLVFGAALVWVGMGGFK
ncbi:MAG: DUF3592 domain-containing protein [Burkholderiales bacterium]